MARYEAAGTVRAKLTEDSPSVFFAPDDDHTITHRGEKHAVFVRVYSDCGSEGCGPQGSSCKGCRQSISCSLRKPIELDAKRLKCCSGLLKAALHQTKVVVTVVKKPESAAKKACKLILVSAEIPAPI